MNVEIVAIGTELLLGEVIDTNGAWLGEELARAGINCRYRSVVGDNVDRIVEVVTRAIERNDAVICCGGLGPTQDDLTRPALAIVGQVDLVFDEDRADVIRHMFGSRGRDMPDNNLLQAFLPDGAAFLDHQPGTAPGFVMSVSSGGKAKPVYALPGVPWEMKEMVLEEVIPALREASGKVGLIRSRTLRTWGASESSLAEQLDALMAELDETGEATLAFLASGIEGLKVRITVGADVESDALRLLDTYEARVRRTLGDIVFGVDEESMETAVLARLTGLGKTLAVAESLTGGLIAARLVDVPGASAAFLGGVVAYDGEVKRNVLGVEEIPVISLECAEQMATGVRRLLGSSIGLGVTGVAGPTTQEGKPVGTVCIAVDIDGDVSSVDMRLPGRRRQVREFACITALNLIRVRLES